MSACAVSAEYDLVHGPGREDPPLDGQADPGVAARLHHEGERAAPGQGHTQVHIVVDRR